MVVERAQKDEHGRMFEPDRGGRNAGHFPMDSPTVDSKKTGTCFQAQSGGALSVSQM